MSMWKRASVEGPGSEFPRSSTYCAADVLKPVELVKQFWSYFSIC